MKAHKRGHADKNTQRKAQRNLPGRSADPKKAIVEALEQFYGSRKTAMGTGNRDIVVMQIQRSALLNRS
jgi:hypothetical protein